MQDPNGFGNNQFGGMRTIIEGMAVDGDEAD